MEVISSLEIRNPKEVEKMLEDVVLKDDKPLTDRELGWVDALSWVLYLD